MFPNTEVCTSQDAEPEITDLNYTFSSDLSCFSNSSVICIVHVILHPKTKIFNTQN